MRDDGIDLRDLVGHVLGKRWLILSTMAICAAAGLAAALLWPKNYEAVVVLLSAPDQASGLANGGISLGSRLGGLASLAGLGASGSSKEAESIAVLESAALARRYIEENQLLPLLFEDNWDPATQSWRKTGESDGVPTLWQGGEFFTGKVRTVERSSGTGIITLTVRWKDADAAANWANGFVALANRQLRDKAIAEAERNVAYLTGQSQQTNLVEVRQAINSLLEGELNKAMLARGSDEFAFRVIDPATAPESPSAPGWMLLVLAGLVVGALLGVFLSLVQLAWKRPMSDAT